MIERRIGALAAPHGLDEGAVDLQAPNRKSREVAKGAVARSKIVDVDLHAEGRQSVENLLHGQAGGQRLLRELHAEGLG